MKTILASETMDIPEGVTVTVAAKLVTVEGPRGKLTRNFKHLNLDFQLQDGGRKLKVDAWFGTRRTMAAFRTAISHFQNLITGVSASPRASATRCASSTLTSPSTRPSPTPTPPLRSGTSSGRRRYRDYLLPLLKAGCIFLRRVR